VPTEPSSDLPLVDLANPDFWQDPAGALAPAREAAPIARTARGEFVVLRYAETERLLADPRMRTIGSQLLTGIGIKDGPLAEWWARVMFNTNPPDHGRLRQLVSRAFTPRHVESLRARVRAMSENMIEPMLDGQDVDFEVGLADPLPIATTCALLGVPEEDFSCVSRWTTEIGKVFATRLGDEQRARCEQAIVDLSALLDDLFRARRNHPKPDVITSLAEASTEQGSLSPAECRAMAINLLFAGHDTTRGLLSVGFHALLSRPEATSAVREAPDIIPQTVEEMLRFEPPTLGSLRAPAEEIETVDLTLPAHTPIHFLFPGGNRDPRVFERPNDFDPRRNAPRPLSFGLGPHFCLGAGLARMEAQEVLSALLDRTRDIEVGETARFVPFATIRRFEKGPILRLFPS